MVRQIQWDDALHGDETTRKRPIRTVLPMKVELVEWPSEEERLSQLRRDHVPRLVLVPEGMAPPLTADVLEDWIRLPAEDEDIRSRVRVLADRDPLPARSAIPWPTGWRRW